MTQILCDENDLLEVADAIREKTGSTDGMYVSDMPNKIRSIAKAVQPDWNQNDESQLDYIKNKPFGETVTTDIIEPESNPVTVTDSNGRVLTRISDTIVYANDIVDLTIEADYSLAESNYQSNVFTYKDVLHRGTPSNYIEVFDFADGYIGWIYRDDNGGGNNLVLFCYAPGTINISCEGYGGSHFAIYDANISQPGIYYYFETFNSVEVALTSSQIKKIDSKFLPEGPVYSPNGTMLSQKLDGDGSFEFVNEPAGIWEYDPKQFTEENRVGTYSVTLGGKSAATGKRALAEGTSTWAKGNYSHAEGNKSYAAGAQSHAEGAQTYADGDQAHAEGWKTSAYGESSHAEGASSRAYGDHTHAEGTDTAAYGQSSHTEGIETSTNGNYAHAEGSSTSAEGSASHAEGDRSTASGDASHAEGHATKSQGADSHAEGFSSVSIGDAAHAEGYNTKAGNNDSPGVCPAHAEGDTTIASAHASHAEGARTTASGMMAHAEGEHTVASGKNSHAGGLGTRATADNQTVVGEWNDVDNDALFIVGNGSGTFDESGTVVTSIDGKNAFVVQRDGAVLAGGSQVITEADLPVEEAQLHVNYPHDNYIYVTASVHIGTDENGGSTEANCFGDVDEYNSVPFSKITYKHVKDSKLTLTYWLGGISGNKANGYCDIEGNENYWVVRHPDSYAIDHLAYICINVPGTYMFNGSWCTFEKSGLYYIHHGAYWQSEGLSGRYRTGRLSNELLPRHKTITIQADDGEYWANSPTTDISPASISVASGPSAAMRVEVSSENISMRSFGDDYFALKHNDFGGGANVTLSSGSTITIGNTTLTEAQLIKIINFIDSIEG